MNGKMMTPKPMLYVRVGVTEKGAEDLIDRLNTLDHRIRGIITGILKFHEGELTRDARNNAPWTNRTGAARRGLFAQLEGIGDPAWDLTLAHSVNYGMFLETAFSGRYSIIMPTLDFWGPVIMQRMQGILDQLANPSYNIMEGPRGQVAQRVSLAPSKNFERTAPEQGWRKKGYTGGGR